jgi:hypothetical protein
VLFYSDQRCPHEVLPVLTLALLAPTPTLTLTLTTRGAAGAEGRRGAVCADDLEP